MALRANNRKGVWLKNIQPNAGVASQYQKKLLQMLAELHSGLLAEITVTVNENRALLSSDMAQDMSFAQVMQNMFKRHGLRWQNRLDQLAPDIAKQFANSSMRHTDLSFRKALRDAGFTIKFKMTPDIENVLHATIADSVSLISDLSDKYQTGIEQAVYRSVAAGFDLKGLTDELQEKYGMAKRRAVGIAIDQNNKAKTDIEDQRRISLEIEEAEWQHSGRGKKPRISHKKAHGKRYKIKEGCLIDGEYIKPGQKRYCGCGSRAFIPGFDG